MNVRDAHAALALGAALMVTQLVVMNGAANAQTTNAAKKQNGTSATAKTAAKLGAKPRTTRAALPPTKASRMQVSINAKNAPVQIVMERMFRDAKAEYIMDNGVAGNVTLRVANQPFETALALLLRASSSPLTYSRDGNVYVIHSARRTAPSVAASGNAPVNNLEPTDPALVGEVPATFAPQSRVLPTGQTSTPQGIVTNGVGIYPTYSVNTGGYGPPPPVTISPVVPSTNGLSNTYFSPSFNTGVGPMFNVGGTFFAPPWFETNNGYYFPYYGYGNQ